MRPLGWGRRRPRHRRCASGSPGAAATGMLKKLLVEAQGDEGDDAGTQGRDLARQHAAAARDLGQVSSAAERVVRGHRLVSVISPSFPFSSYARGAESASRRARASRTLPLPANDVHSAQRSPGLMPTSRRRGCGGMTSSRRGTLVWTGIRHPWRRARQPIRWPRPRSRHPIVALARGIWTLPPTWSGTLPACSPAAACPGAWVARPPSAGSIPSGAGAASTGSGGHAGPRDPASAGIVDGPALAQRLTLAHELAHTRQLIGSGRSTCRCTSWGSGERAAVAAGGRLSAAWTSQSAGADVHLHLRRRD